MKHKTKILFLITLFTLLITLTCINATNNTTTTPADNTPTFKESQDTQIQPEIQQSDKKEEKIKQTIQSKKEENKNNKTTKKSTNTDKIQNTTKTLQKNTTNKTVKQDGTNKYYIRSYNELYNIVTNQIKKYQNFDSVEIQLKQGNYNFSKPIIWGSKSSPCIKTLRLYGNKNILDANYQTNFIIVEKGYTLELYDFKVRNTYDQIGSVLNNMGITTIKESEFKGNSVSSRGGVIYNQGTINIYDTKFIDNNADLYYGGSIYNDRGILKIKNCSFTNNTAENGGVIYNNNGKLNITNSYFSYNRAYRGGVIYNTGSNNITTSTFKDNHAYTAGGVIYNDKSTTIIRNSKFINSQSENGGVIYNNQNMRIITSNFTQNSADNGGVIYNNGNIEINSSNLLDNNATYNGGVNLNYGDIIIKSSNLKNNKAERGGVNYNFNSKIKIIKSTLQANTATKNGGVNYNEKGIIEIQDSTSKNNKAQRAGSIYNNKGKLSIINTNFINDKADMDADVIINYGNNTYFTNNIITQDKYNTNTIEILTTRKINGKDNNIKLIKTNKTEIGDIVTITSPVKDQSQINMKIPFYDGSYHIASPSINTYGVVQVTHEFKTQGTKLINIKYDQYNITIKQEVTTPKYDVYNTIQLINTVNKIKNQSTIKDTTINIYKPIKLNQSLTWGNSKIKTLKINGNNNLIDAKNQFIKVEKGYTLELYNFKIRYANAERGSVIYNKGTVNIYDSIFLNNTAKSNGGVIYNDQGRIKILNSSFSNNNATNGACIYNNNGLVNITKSYFSFNKANRGAVNYNMGKLNITSTILKNNQATENGGVNYNNPKTTLIIKNSELLNNKASKYGGVNYNNNNASIEIYNSQLESNNAINGGVNANYGTIEVYYSDLNFNQATRGGVNYNFKNIDITDSTLNNNKVNSNGGVNYNDKATMNINNCTLNSNTATNNGGINYNNKGKITLTDSLIEYNDATRGGVNYNTGNMEITTSNFYYNTAENGAVNYNDNGSMNISEIYSNGNSATRATDTYNNKGNLKIDYSKYREYTYSDTRIFINYGGNVQLYNNNFYKDDYNNEELIYTDTHIKGNNNIFHLSSSKDVYAFDNVTYKLPVKDLKLTKFSVSAYGGSVKSKCVNNKIESTYQFTTSGYNDLKLQTSEFYNVYIEQNVKVRPPKTTYDVYNFNQFTDALSKIKKLNVNDECTINIYSDIKIGKLSIWADSNNVRELTINGNNHILNGQNRYKFISIKPGYILNLNNVIIQNCNSVSYSGEERAGGAILNKGKLNIENSEFKNNKANSGGAIYNTQNTTIKKTKFTNNNAIAAGAIYNEGDLHEYNNQFIKNIAENNGGAISTEDYGYSYSCNSKFKENKAPSGAATEVSYGSVHTIENCEFSNNKGNYRGGAIYTLRASLYVSGSTFNNNAVNENENSKSTGGAIYADYADVEIEECSFTSNKAVDGSAICCEGSDMNITGCNFNKNNALQHSTVCNFNGNVHVENCDFDENKAIISSSIFNDEDGNLTVKYSEFHDNYGYHAGTICSYGYAYVYNSDFYNNDIGSDAEIVYSDYGDGYVEYCKYQSGKYLISDYNSYYYVEKKGNTVSYY